MAIKSLKVLNVMVFQRQWRKNNRDCKDGQIKSEDSIHEAFQLNFSDGINVLIGENGVGKTTLLKMIYAAAQWSNETTDVGKTNSLLNYFSSGLKNNDLLMNTAHKEGYCYYEVSDGKHKFTNSLSHNGMFDFDQWLGLNIQSVFIPTTEMLSHAKGFLALSQKFKLPFDGTQIDIIVNASLPEAREVPMAMEGILKKISQVIDGQVIMEEDAFYVVKKDGRKVEFSLEAEGLRKLGLIWKLIWNGLLEKDSILLWDEPEANLNPELYPLVADILLELEKNGVQIFIATHSYNLAKYLELRRAYTQQVQFHNLYKGTSKLPGTEEWETFTDKNKRNDEIYSESAYYLSKLDQNHIIIADERLLDEAMENFTD